MAWIRTWGSLPLNGRRRRDGRHENLYWIPNVLLFQNIAYLVGYTCFTGGVPSKPITMIAESSRWPAHLHNPNELISHGKRRKPHGDRPFHGDPITWPQAYQGIPESGDSLSTGTGMISTKGWERQISMSIRNWGSESGDVVWSSYFHKKHGNKEKN